MFTAFPLTCMFFPFCPILCTGRRMVVVALLLVRHVGQIRVLLFSCLCIRTLLFVRGVLSAVAVASSFGVIVRQSHGCCPALFRVVLAKMVLVHVLFRRTSFLQGLRRYPPSMLFAYLEG